jgi:2-polyprenyl-3-methyl-5-hydroxy-6-metoxy-1,4-benzoquinol methylase
LTAGFKTDQYWEQRLRDHYSLEGVGYLRLGRRFNEWMYRIRGEVFDRVVGELGIGAGAVVADVGAGTGFYVERWLRLGAAVTGIDLTEVAVGHLRTRFPGATFVQANIGEPLEGALGAGAGRFDVVSAFDVLFHIVDDQQFARALANIAALLKPGGLFLWSDNFVHRPTIRVTHQVSRSLPEITAALTKAGFTIDRRVPMFVLMNYPADTNSKLAQWAWTALMAPAMVSDRLGGWLGAALYPIERRLLGRVKESASTELMVCRRNSPGPGPSPASTTSPHR